MNKLKVYIDTKSDVREFVGIATSIPEPVYLEDGSGLRVSAKSLMGVMYGISEFNNLYILSEHHNLNQKFNKFAI